MVPKVEQSIQGGQLKYFYSWANIARDGKSDLSKFVVIGAPGFRSFAINRNGEVYKW